MGLAEMGETLFLAHRIPFPPDRGDKIRSCAMLRELVARGPVHVATFGETEADMAAEAELASVVASHILVRRTISNLRAGLNALAAGKPVSLVAFDSPEIRHFVSRLIATRPIDTIFVFSGQMAQFLPPSFAGRVVMDFVDMDSAKFAAYAQAAQGPMKLVHAREGAAAGYVRTTGRPPRRSVAVRQPGRGQFVPRDAERSCRARRRHQQRHRYGVL